MIEQVRDVVDWRRVDVWVIVDKGADGRIGGQSCRGAPLDELFPPKRPCLQKVA